MSSRIDDWLLSLDTFRTFAAQSAVRSNHSNCFWINGIRAKPARPSCLGTQFAGASYRALVDPKNPFYSKVRDLKREEQAA